MNEKWLYAANFLVSRFINAGKRDLPNPLRSVLVVKWDEIGDMATAVHVFDLIKNAHPQAAITVLCKPFVATLIAAHPSVDEVITHIDDWQQRYDVVVELRGTWKTLFKSLHWKTGTKYRLDRGWIRFQQRGNQPHELLTNFRIVSPLLREKNEHVKVAADLVADRRLYPTGDDLLTANAWVQWAMDGAEADVVGYAILHTGARRSLRRWPVGRYASLSQWLLSDKKLMPIWVGTEEEQAQIQEAMTLGGQGKVWISGVTEPASAGLLSFFAFIQQASLYVGNESGPLQLADIAAVPLVAIYGPGVPDVFYPISSRSKVLHEILPCNPCDQVTCAQPQDRCIDRIELTSVKMAVDEVLGDGVQII